MKVITAVMVMLTAAAAAAADESSSTDRSVAELKDLVRTMQGQIDELKAKNDQNWLTEKRAEEIKGLVHDVLADADTRASLLQSGAVAGYDKNFFLSSADGNWMLKIAGQMQVRFVYNNQDVPGVDENRWGFENRRTKLRFFGHAVDPSWQYLVLGAFDRDDSAIPSPPSGDPADAGNFVLDEAFITKDFGNGWKVRVGQFKPPFMREELVSSSRQLAVERSLVNEEFNQDRVQGIEAAWRGDRFSFAGAFSDGFYPSALGSDNTPWQLEDTEYAFTARGELLLSGDWKAFDDFSGWRGGGNAFLLGAAVHYQVDEFGTSGPNPYNGATTEVEALHFTADASAKFDGIGLYGAVVYRNLDMAAGTDLDQYGFVIQGSIFLTDEWEAFARYEWGDADTAGVEDLSVITVGANRYWAKHNLKWQTDIGFGLNPVRSIWSTSSAGWRSDPAGEDGQLVLRSQIQLLF
jgi:hypothetical protein